MSFSYDVRNELARVMPEKECCCRAELAALLQTATISWEEQGTDLILGTEMENAAIARKVFKLFKQTYGLQSSVRMEPRKRFGKSRIYEVKTIIPAGQWSILGELGLGEQIRSRRQSLTGKTCCKRAFLRGAFLNRGSVNRPEGEYHLEIIVADSRLAAELRRLMARFGIEARQFERKSNLVLYIKESEKISDFLRVVGASAALLEFENARVLKSVRNDVNRQVNCETANLAKTVDASVRQIECIRKLTRVQGWGSLPPELQELARLRLEYPDHSLKELGEMMATPLSKSGVAYRMRKLEKIAEERMQIMGQQD